MSPMLFRRTVLTELLKSEPYKVPTETLLIAVRIHNPDIGKAELVAELSWLGDKDMVDSEPDRADPDNRSARKWFITDAGKKALR